MNFELIKRKIICIFFTFKKLANLPANKHELYVRNVNILQIHNELIIVIEYLDSENIVSGNVVLCKVALEKKSFAFLHFQFHTEMIHCLGNYVNDFLQSSFRNESKLKQLGFTFFVLEILLINF